MTTFSRSSKYVHSLAGILIAIGVATNAYGQCPTADKAAQPQQPDSVNLASTVSIVYSWTVGTLPADNGYTVFLRKSGSLDLPTPACSASSSTATSCTGSSLTAGSYVWFVRSKYSLCTTGVDSSTKQFTIDCPSITISPLALNNATVSQTYGAKLGANGGTSPYTFRISSGSLPSGLTLASDGTISGTPSATGSYTFEVRASDAIGCPATKSYTIVVAGTTASCPNPPTLASPANGATVPAGNVTFSWTEVAGASGYLLFAGLDGATPTFIGGTTTTSTTRTIDANRSIEWYVVVMVPNCPDKASSHFKFTTASCPQTAPGIIGPSGGSQFDEGKPITFSWTPAAGAAGYDVMLSSDEGKTFSPKLSVVGESTTSVTGTFSAGSYIWFVRANYPLPCLPVPSQPARFVVSSPQSCSATGPALVGPANGASVTLPVTFDWNEVPGAIGYNVYIIPSATGIATLIGSTTSSTLFVTSSLPQGTLQWGVAALFENCPPAESVRNTITVIAPANCPTASPTLVAPANGASNVTNPVTFDWNAVTGATKYVLIVSLNGGAPTPIATTERTEFTAAIPNGTFEWFVQAIFDNCPATQSLHFRFTTAATAQCPANPDKPKLLAPVEGATNLSSPVTFQWSSVSGATSYRLLVSLNNSSLTALGTTTNTQATVPLPQGSVSWAVEALFGDCPPTISSRGSFTVLNGAQCPTTSPTPLSPPNGATNLTSPVTFQWSSVTGAIGYELFVSLNGTSFESLGGGSGTQLTRIIPAGSFSWYVVTTFPGCPAVRSAAFSFTVRESKSCPTGTITLTSPANGATVTSPVLFSWTAVPVATAYRLWLSIDGTAPAQVAKVTAPSASVPLPSGSAEWYVEAIFADCPSISSPHGRFTIQRASNCASKQAPTLVSPVASGGNVPAVTSPVDLVWNASAGAAAYRVWIASNNQPFTDIGIVVATRVKVELPAGAYQWYVEALFEGCPAVPSSRTAFRVQSTSPPCSNDSPAIISPADGATGVSSPVTFLWSSVANAEEYRVFASLDNGPVTLIAETRDTSFTKAVPPGTIVWYVDAGFRGCNSTRSARARFTVRRSAACGTEAPQLVSPVNEATNVSSPVDFVWNPVSGAAAYVLWVRFGDGAPTPIAETQDTHLAKSVPDGRFEWWVLAQLGGCPPVESKHYTFTVPPSACETKRPVLLTPPDGAKDISPTVYFSWTPVPKAKSYKLWVAVENQPPSVVATPATPNVTLTLPSGTIHWLVEAVFDNCPVRESGVGSFTIASSTRACRKPDKPTATVAGQVLSGTAYGVRWTALANVTLYELQESTTLDFSNATTQVVINVYAMFSHDAADKPVQYLYRVRGISSCRDDRGPYSDVVGVFIIPLKSASSQRHASAEVGTSSSVAQTLFIPGSSTPSSFTATTDKPWLTVTPSSGTIPPEGITLTVKTDPSALLLGTNTGTVVLTYSGAGKGELNGTTPTTVPVSVSLVTPVAPGGKNTPPPDSLIIPAVAHAAGANDSLFESDVRVTNLSAQTMKYLVNFTPSGVDGTQSGSSTTIQVDAGATMALDDVLASFFGSGSAGASATGTLELRPLTSSSTTSGFATVPALTAQTTTVASSRTYNVTPNGTFGQYIPAIPFSQFIGKSTGAAKSVLSFQQIAQSAAYRTNFGLVEGAGEPANVLLSVFDNSNAKIAEIPVSLQAGEHKQINSILAINNIALSDGRIEVEVTSSTGKVTAYASTVDNVTNDPLLISPVLKSSVSATRYVIPGVAYINTGIANWRTDLRLFNAGNGSMTATLTYYPQGNPSASQSKDVTVAAGEVKAIDNILSSFFGVAETNAGGSVVVTTAASTSLIATARTYNQTSNGTYGQFIPGVTPNDAVGNGGRSLQILQLEHSNRMRTNLGVAETTGNSATVEISVILPDSKVAPKVQIPLAANEFRQISLAVFGLSNVYNARASVKVIDGNGKVTAYGSVIDNVTQDPTYVPAQ